MTSAEYIRSDKYQEMKDSFMDFIETAYIMDLKMGVPTIDVEGKVSKAIDKFTKNVIKNSAQ